MSLSRISSMISLLYLAAPKLSTVSLIAIELITSSIGRLPFLVTFKVLLKYCYRIHFAFLSWRWKNVPRFVDVIFLCLIHVLLSWDFRFKSWENRSLRLYEVRSHWPLWFNDILRVLTVHWIKLLNNARLTFFPAAFFAESKVSLLEETSTSTDCISKLINGHSLRTEVRYFNRVLVMTHLAYLLGIRFKWVPFVVTHLDLTCINISLFA